MSELALSCQAVLFLHAQTPLHPGSGTALGVVDLPVQRERHTQWPTIPGSSLKGVLRQACMGLEEGIVNTMFGPDSMNSNAHGGALSITDARIAAFPVRSLKGGFAWVTCREVLERLSRDMGLCGTGRTPALPAALPNADNLLCAADSSLMLGDSCSVILEEFEFNAHHGDENFSAWAQWLAERGLSSPALREQFTSRLVVLHQDDFTHFVRFATEITARISIDPLTKTTKDGGLFYEEFLPAETLLYSIVIATHSRNKDHAMTAAGIAKTLDESLPSVLQIGAGETIGKGLCIPRLSRGEGR